ncbi:hypothetical protein DEM27_10370 [Metarhizobium album]|uniref:Uncharacterized protein n=1 Tax=Metarhizobium album TaxID=2182425 RepID=A0A2U2DTW9_9HYPH|nr:hypothetical protein [Rhizobium album]PWE56758.1 hypothetical protein DEM27_10370 [Rhizobium album]
MRLIATSLLVLVAVQGAWAGCGNYTDGSLDEPAPMVIICFDGKCEDAKMEFECGNAHGAQIGYSGGWRVEYATKEPAPGQTEYSDDTESIVSRNGVKVDETKVSCKPITKDACRFPSDP